MENPTQIIESGGKKYLLTWIRDDDVSKYAPLAHVHGIVFNEKDEILIGRSKPTSSWKIMGGRSEEGETIEQTLSRELMEEGDITVSKIYPLGVQKVEVIEGKEKDDDPYYQVRCVALLDELLPQTPDPAPGQGLVWERKFVPMRDITTYILWGENGAAMFEEAIKLYEKIRQKV